MTGPLAGLLTDEQKEQVRVLREEHRKQLEELRRQVESENLTRADARGRMQALRESMRASFGNLLTPEQRSALETRHEQREAERAGRHELGRRTAAEVLELTDAEAAEFEAIVETAREAMMEVRKDARVEGLSIDDSRQRLDDIRETRNTALADLMDRNRVEIVIIHDVLVHQFAPRQFHRRLSGQPLKGSGQDSWSGRHRRQRAQG